ncbi:transcription termination/antitermination protein NusA [Sulfobacillus acidophilus]|uniref:Transcription termination/antitermination protein NusA n=1 Tax=Sulfobacillus acidophilus TaxID=53633 RepID=A0ABS3AVK9_9FIRM|nr:transcription termination/antitermination protein NusA [Sulfobacillus acidophilus]
MEINQLNLNSVIEQVGREKNITKDTLISALEAAMLSAARKKLGANSDLEARYNEEVGEVEIYEFRRIVDQVENTDTEIAFEDALKLDPELTKEALGEDLGVKLDSKEFGRIAAQNAKQIIVQRIREAERCVVFDEYKDRKDELITGTVRRFERGNMVVDLGRAEAVVPVKEQVSKENIRIGDRIVAYVLDVLEASRGHQIILSRTHPNLVVKLFKQEVPEISEEIVKIEGAAREAGFRTKIAVQSRDSDVDPVGACVGMRGSRVQAVVQELRGEKIDIVPFEEDAARYVCNALAPAEITRVLVNEAEHNMQMVVPDDQLSLAIGRRGQNVRLAAELTGWKIDISSESKVAQEKEIAWKSLSRVLGLSEFQVQILYNHGFRSASDIIAASDEVLQSIPGLEQEQLLSIKDNAKKVIEQEADEQELEKQAFREEAKVLFLVSDLVEKEKTDKFSIKSLTGLNEDELTSMLEAGYEDLADIYLERDLHRFAQKTKLKEEKVQEVREQAAQLFYKLSFEKVPLTF